MNTKYADTISLDEVLSFQVQYTLDYINFELYQPKKKNASLLCQFFIISTLFLLYEPHNNMERVQKYICVPFKKRFFFFGNLRTISTIFFLHIS